MSTGGQADRVREGAPRNMYGARDGMLALLGLSSLDTLPLLKRIEQGFDYRSMEALQRALGIPMESVAELAQIAPRTLSRRKEQGRLMPDESDRLVRISRLFSRTLELFDGDIEAARRWFSSRLVALGGETPFYFARTETGAREVENLIGRLEHGVFS
jgi:putative toxin-antitoxin system antitoxin component (TIGR02293 family)